MSQLGSLSWYQPGYTNRRTKVVPVTISNRIVKTMHLIQHLEDLFFEFLRDKLY